MIRGLHPLASRSVLVTGGTGFLGRHLVARLVAERARVVTFARGAGYVAGAEHVRGDVRDAHSVSALIERRFDVVYHLAGASGQDPGAFDAALLTNCAGVFNMLDAIRLHAPGTRFRFVSSRLVYGRAERLPVDEEHPLRPLSFYAMQKRDGEEYCAHFAEQFDIPAIVLRLSNPYGPHTIAGHNRYNVANWMLDELIRRRAVLLYGDGEQLRDYLYIDDAVDALLCAGATPLVRGRAYNVGSGVPTRLIDFVRAGVLAAGAGAFEPTPWPDDLLRAETGDFVADIARIGHELGWAPRVSLMEGVSRTVAAQRRMVDRARRSPREHDADAGDRDLEVAA
jgi:UDP-glucose 4-epimerase